MEPNIVLILAAILLGAIIIGAGVFYGTKRRRSRELRERFGPEYDRALEEHHHQSAAEHDLLDREKRARGLQLRPLSDSQRLHFAKAWASVQRHFVDDPVTALSEAHALLEDVMRERGYPTTGFEEEVALLSVHHPRSLQHYRAAHALAQDRHAGGTGTEELRQAVIHYRVLFEDLLEVEDQEELRDTRPYASTPVERPTQHT